MFKKFNCAFLDIHWLDFHDDKPKLDKNGYLCGIALFDLKKVRKL